MTCATSSSNGPSSSTAASTKTKRPPQRQIGEDAIKRIVKHVRDWWDYEGYDNWIDSIEADRADARYKRERDYA